MGWLEYSSSLAPFAPPPPDGAAQRGGRPVVILLGDDIQLSAVLDAARYDKSERGPAANRGLLVHDTFDEAVVLKGTVRQGEGEERQMGVSTRLRTYSLTEGGADWFASLQVGRIRALHMAWVGGKALFLFSARKEEWLRGKEKLKALNDMGGRPAAHIAARNSGIRAKDATADSAGGLSRKTYLCRGARCMISSPVWPVWRLYNREIAEVVGIIYRPCERPPRSSPAFVLAKPHKYCGHVFFLCLPTVIPVAATERIMGRRRRCARTTIHRIPAWGITVRKSQRLTCRPGLDAERVVAHPSKPPFEKSHPGGLYDAFSRAK